MSTKAALQHLVENVSKLVSFPSVAMRVEETLADETANAADVGAVIETDPALSATILRIANSPIYNVSGQIDHIGEAVTRVGEREIRNLVYAVCATESFKDIPNELISVGDFWRHSLHCAVAARHLGAIARVPRRDALFTAGLLHDIGSLVLFSQRAEESKQVLNLSLDKYDGTLLHLCESEVLGFDHADVGAELAKLWNFPDILVDAIQFHHNPTACDETTEFMLTLNAANSIAVLAELDSIDRQDGPPIDQAANELLQLNDDSLAEAVRATQEGAAEAMHSVFGELVRAA